VSPSEEPRHAAFTGAVGAAFGWHSAHAMQMRSVSGCCCFPVRHIITKMLVPAVLSFLFFIF